MASLGRNMMGVVNNIPKAVFLPGRMSSKVDAWFRVSGAQSAGTGDNGAKLAAKSPAPLLPLVWVNDVDTFALSIERPGLIHDDVLSTYGEQHHQSQRLAQESREYENRFHARVSAHQDQPDIWKQHTQQSNQLCRC